MLTTPQPVTPAAEQSSPNSQMQTAVEAPGRVDVGWLQSGQSQSFNPPTRPGDLGTLGRYRVCKELGRGGMGAVYLGFDDGLDRKVALKVILPQAGVDIQARERFLREARSAARVRSDHVVTIFDVGEDRGVPFLSMEYLQGSSLADYVKKHGRLSVGQVLRIGRETALGLQAAHQLGLVHRDIKPANLWLEAPKGRVKILDFGLAMQQQDTHLTDTGMAVGTPAYMSPEQARSEPLDGRSDLFSLGSVLYQLLTGQLPFTGATNMAILTALAVDSPAPICSLNPQVPEELARVVHRLLQKAPRHRFQDATALIEAIDFLAAPRKPAAPLVVKVEPLAAPGPTENVWSVIDEAIDQPVTPPQRTPGAPATHVAAHLRRRWPLVGAVVLSMGVVVGLLLRSPRGATESPPTAEATSPPAVAAANEPIRPARGEKPATRPERPADADRSVDRAVAEWVIQKGGKVSWEGHIGQAVGTLKELPARPFVLSIIEFTSNTQLTEANLAPIAQCRGLTSIYLAGSLVTDGMLAHLKDLPQLRTLDLMANPRVTDAGIAHLKGKPWVFVRLTDTRVNGEGLEALRGCETINSLVLDQTPLTDRGMEVVATMPRLIYLSLHSVPLTDRGIRPLAGLRDLERLTLANVPLTDASMKSLAELPRLRHLDISSSKVTDAGLRPFEQIEGSFELNLNGTAVTRAAVERLWKQRPRMTILWNGGIYQAHELEDPDRVAAGFIIERGGSVVLVGQQDEIRQLNSLPPGPFQVAEVRFRRETFVDDAWMRTLKQCKGLTTIHAPDCGFSPLAARMLMAMHELRDIWVEDPFFNDELISELAEHRRLTRVNLAKTPITDAGLRVLQDCPQLETLMIGYTGISGDGLKYLKHCPKLRRLDLFKTPVDDRIFKYLKDLPNLELVELRHTRVTAEAMEELIRRKPPFKVIWNQGTYDPKR